MNAKEEGIVTALKEISELESEIAKEAMADREYGIATHSMIVTTITAEAAEIIQMQAAELEVLKEQQAKENSTASNIGKRVRLAVADDKVYIIVAEDQERLLIKTISASPALEVNKKEVHFID
jgi:tricorn protease-like protein